MPSSSLVLRNSHAFPFEDYCQSRLFQRRIDRSCGNINSTPTVFPRILRSRQPYLLFASRVVRDGISIVKIQTDLISIEPISKRKLAVHRGVHSLNSGSFWKKTTF
eukprot:Pompholyxophrys_punicea_v1_NODE_376_length_2093_cov_35.121153.p4 type:complete len:106 gc:universal NODE_376_length_2093_cov_35.121153:1232-1549(+)